MAGTRKQQPIPSKYNRSSGWMEWKEGNKQSKILFGENVGQHEKIINQTIMAG
jgi:hypothetical protein